VGFASRSSALDCSVSISCLVLHVFFLGTCLTILSAAGEDKSTNEKSASKDQAAGKIQTSE